MRLMEATWGPYLDPHLRQSHHIIDFSFSSTALAIGGIYRQLMESTVRLVVMASGGGTNLQALIDAIATGVLDCEIAAVVSDRADAYALTRADTAGINTHHLPLDAGELRRNYDRRLAQLVTGHHPDLVILAGWMRLLSMEFLHHFPERVLNIHPALPTEFPGTNAIERAWEEHLSGVRDHSGVMIHLVPDEGVDDGPVLATVTVPILDGDSFASFAARMHAAEHALLPVTIARYRPPSRSSA
jgi:phosphoribosylglycinamide formyltransferase 1